jgi:Family of unknown function (DUF5681)
MAANKKAKPPKKKPTGAYPVGYCQPPKNQFVKGTSGNISGLPKGLPSPQQILVEEAARLVKVKIGDQTIQMSKHHALMRKLLDIGMGGDVGAIRLSLAYLSPAHAELAGAAPNIEPPLTEAEIAVFNTFGMPPECDSHDPGSQCASPHGA